MLYGPCSAGQAIVRRDVARRCLWEVIGRETIVNVHGGTNDFLALRWIHWKVIDTLEGWLSKNVFR